jgi:beta-lactam-binding protein with PASTA domain
MCLKKIFKNSYIKNLLLAVLIVFVLLFAVLNWLEIYTRHGEEVEVPNVKGLLVERAEPLFTGKNLYCQIIDSTYSKSTVPGSIIETIPPIGSKVKRGRTIYLKINSFTARLVSVPDVKDISQREAMAKLQSLGFEKVEIRVVPGAYRDLVVGLGSRGISLEFGDKIPINTPLYLLVSSGTEEVIFPENSSIVLEEDPDESWF